MKYFLLVIIFGLCAGGYFEYTVLQKQLEADSQQIAGQSEKIDALQAENKKVEEDKTELTKSVADAQAQIADLTKQVQDAQTALAAAKAAAVASASSKPKTAAPVAPPRPTNDLGTITSLDGKSYQNCHLLRVKTDGIVVSDTGGITELSFVVLSADLQKKFNYDPHQAVFLTDAQVQTLEAQRKAAESAK
jgi:small-conductance mechanosensitive channel